MLSFMCLDIYASRQIGQINNICLLEKNFGKPQMSIYRFISNKAEIRVNLETMKYQALMLFQKRDRTKCEIVAISSAT